MGVIVARLPDVATLRRYGSLPQNVNFAIRGTEVQEFLSTARVGIRVARLDARLEADEVGEKGAAFVVAIECLR